MTEDLQVSRTGRRGCSSASAGTYNTAATEAGRRRTAEDESSAARCPTSVEDYFHLQQTRDSLI